MERQPLEQLCDEQALGLLDAAEGRQLSELLEAHDPAATAQLRRSEELVTELAWLAPPAEPPALLRSRLLNQVREQTRAVEAPVRAAIEAKPVTARRAPWAMGWAVAAGLAVASLYSYFALRAANGELGRVRNELASVQTDAARSRKVLAVVLSRDARFIKISTSQNEPLFRAFWGGAAGLVLSGANVPALAQGRTLQLWVVPKGGGNPVSAGVFAPQVDGQVLMIAETAVKPENAAALAISDEPMGGSAQPTTKPVYVGAVGD